jgi:hypothetical protein
MATPPSKWCSITKPQQQMLDDLFAFASTYKTAGHEIIIMIDANSPDDDAAMEKVFGQS